MAQKYAVIPAEMVSSFKLQNPELRLEEEISNLLDQKNIPDDIKVKLLSHLILRYQQTSQHRIYPEANNSMQEEKSEQKEEETSDIPIPDAMLGMIKSSVPRTYHEFIFLILERMKQSKAFYNARGELTINNVPVEGSHLVDLFSYVMRNNKTQIPPKGLPEFLDLLIRLNIPKQWIGNKILRSALFHSNESRNINKDKSMSSETDLPVKKKNLKVKHSKSNSPYKKWKKY